MMPVAAARPFVRTLPPLVEGTLVAGRYRLSREVGQGGALWIAHDTKAGDAKVFCDFLPGAVGRDAAAFARVRNEAAAAIGIDHPRIVRTRDCVADPQLGGIAFFVLDHVEGRPFEDVLEEEPLGLPLGRVLAWAVQIEEALDHAHGRGVSHGPPLRLWIDPQDRALLFGCAASHTPPGAGPGAGRSAADRRMTVRALAAFVHSALAGEAFAEPAPGSKSGPAPIEGIPERVNEALRAALSEGGACPGTPGEFVAFLQGKGKPAAVRPPAPRPPPSTVPPPPAPPRVARPRRRRGVAVAVGAIVVLGVLWGLRGRDRGLGADAGRARAEAQRLEESWQKAAGELRVRVARGDLPDSPAMAEARRLLGPAEARDLTTALGTAETLLARRQFSDAIAAYSAVTRRLGELHSRRATVERAFAVETEWRRLDQRLRANGLAARPPPEHKVTRALLESAGEALARGDEAAARRNLAAAEIESREALAAADRMAAERAAALARESAAKTALETLETVCREVGVAEGEEAREARRRLARGATLLTEADFRNAEAAFSLAEQLLGDATSAARREGDVLRAEREAAEALATAKANSAKAEGLFPRLRSAIERVDKAESESLLAELDRLIPRDARVTALRREVAAMPSIERTRVDLGGGVSLELVRIPGCEFRMGSPDDEEGRNPDEIQHRVLLTSDYLLGVTEVTQAQWKAVMGTDPSQTKGADRPVEQVSWDDAVAFCEELSRKTGAKFRLPTEAEWERACRGGTTGARYGPLDEVAWYSGNSKKEAHPVASRKANPFGLFDMLGGVMEWCSDCYGAYPTSPGAVQDPRGSRSGWARLARGGSWYVDAAWCRASVRSAHEPSLRGNLVGFRVARDLVATPPAPAGREAADAASHEKLRVDLGGGVSMELVRIPRGEFLMGSPENEESRADDERRHRVVLTRDFYMGLTEVTQAQWKAVMGSNPSTSAGDDLPVESVLWDDAVSFCEKLSKQTGKRFRLPTEAEWEYSCRAGTAEERYGVLGDVAWYSGNSGAASHPVGGRKANVFGLHDTLGSVWEWCSDVYGPYPAADPARDPVGPESGWERVVRGGSFTKEPAQCRAALRNRGNLWTGYRDAGFRVARDVDGPPSGSPPKSASAAMPLERQPVDLGGGVKLWMVRIPKGEFVMGSPPDEEGRFPSEGQHRVRLTRDFYLGVTEVTQAQWHAVMGGNPAGFEGAELPVERVSWDDAVAFCEAMSRKTRMKFRLPTEAEWEYACRAGAKGARYGPLGDIAWVKQNSASQTHPVLGLRPNAWGLHDMLGNVGEWCGDWQGNYPSDQECATDPTGPRAGEARVLRGGSWNNEPMYCRAAYRNWADPSSTGTNVGLRVARDGDDPPAESPRKEPAAPASVENVKLDLGGGVTLELQRIPRGEFRMGSPENEAGRGKDEAQHRVVLTKDYYLGVTEVTQAQWKAVMGTDPSRSKGADRPVEQVSWDDAVAFCETLSRKTGAKFRLPTEAEWEYACRAGATAERYGPLDEVAWHSGNNGGEARPVRGRRANGQGLHDTLGSVWEWCSNWYGRYSADGEPVRDPTGPRSGTHRVMRGGSSEADAKCCRAAHRAGAVPTLRHGRIGFRVARDADEGPRKKPAEPAPDEKVKVDLGGGVAMELVRIPRGEFRMGSPEDEAFRLEDEAQHMVVLTKDYYLGVTEVTQAQWKAVMGTDPSRFKGADRPVEQVSWDDAVEFCEKLSKKTGAKFRLPTEAEWEYACRAGTTAACYGPLDEVAWHLGTSTSPVAGKKPNAYGLHDMLGNVSEWCADWYGIYPADRESVQDPMGPPSGVTRVLRGGAWNHGYAFCRAAIRSRDGPSRRNAVRGFRVARAP